MATARLVPIPSCLSFPRFMARRCSPKQSNSQDFSLTDRQQRLAWWDQKKLQSQKFLLVGAGGLGSNLAKILVQIGTSSVFLIDPDLVEDSNRNRQFFTLEDVGKPKAHRLLSNLAPFATARTRLCGYYLSFEAWLVKFGRRSRFDMICCGVDSIPTMANVARFGLETQTPVVYLNVSENGEACRMFLQRPTADAPCFVCYLPDALAPRQVSRTPCLPIPAIADILHVAVGLGARAAMGEIMGSPIGEYNCRDFTFGGIDLVRTIAKRPDCPLCSQSAREYGTL